MTATAPTSTAPDFQQVVSPADKAPDKVSFGGATVVVPPSAVKLPVGVGITKLVGQAVPVLDPGMTDVTGKTTKAFRFTPHPMQFATTVSVTLPYDPTLIPPDFTDQDVYTYFYDDVALCWQVLQRDSVDTVNHTITSLTNHFTDMINAVSSAPENPENASFDPNQIKGIQAADPGTGVTVISPPQVGNLGDNVLGYPISAPPGRRGVQPSLAVTYDSAGANGWLGVGWNLATPTLTIDTRFGVPRYDTATETETYLLNGEQLTPVANHGPAQPRTAERVFHTRVEGGFARIIRHGDSPKNYTWEVVDKAGTHSFYGALPGATGPEAGATLADGKGDVFVWALREVRDAHGNFMRYSYATVDSAGGVAPGADGNEPGRNIYPQKITYTGSGGTEGRYAVTFVRDRDLGEPQRTDVSIDARGGFKRVTADLLRRIDVTFDGGLVRRYELAYTTGAFDKTLLKSITQMDDQGATVGTHQFSYFDDVRDVHGTYQAFNSVDWTVPGDGLGDGKFNLLDNVGDGSALSSNTSIQGGVHLYVGVGTPGGKPTSIGVKVGSGHSSSEGVLALVDVDGDNLPDKVFRKVVNGTVTVWYHKNLSGPTGQLRFDDHAQQLNLPGIGAESSNSQTQGLEGYAGAVAVQLDFVNTFATTSQYFTDVNDDGIADLVNGTTVLFGRVGAGGVPVYGISADDTPVPVTPGHVDTTGILADLSKELAEQRDSHPLLDSVRRWVAPFSGVVRIDGTVALAHAAAAPADGVRVAIQKENDELWSTLIDPQDTTAHTPTGVSSVSVTRGDRLYFRVQSRDDGSSDEVNWDPVVTYQNVSAGVTDVNGLPAYRFDAARDFTLGGRDVQITAPLTGTIHLSGDLSTSVALTDDVTAVITRDGTPVLQQKIANGAPGTAPVNLDIDVQKGQVLRWRVQVDSPVDLGKVSWRPRATYTAADGVAKLTDQDGNPLIDIFPPYNVDIYPADDLTAPQGFFEAPVKGQAIVSPALAFNFGDQKPSGQVAFTVKRSGGLVGKSFFDIKDGVVTTPDSLILDVNGGDDLYFDFSTLDPKLRSFLASQTVQMSFFPSPDIEFPVPEIDEVVPSAFHSPAADEAFPQPYRGWGVVGYNGNGSRATAPIAQGDLVIDDHFGDSLPTTIDPQAQRDSFGADPTVTPPKVIPFIPSPKDNRWGVGDHSWITATGASSSRLGTQSIIVPQASDFAGADAVPRLSRSTQLSLTGAVGSVGSLGGSVADGQSTGEVDFLDMNGDGFPDVVSAAGIQYSDPSGGLGDTRGSLPSDASGVRGSSNTAGNASAGSPGRTTPTGRGTADPSGTGTANDAQAGNDMAPLGAPVTVGESLGGSSSDTDFDLLDINGDGLPDRVYANGTVRLNLGYSFGKPEVWRNPAPLNDGSGSNAGVNLGFNTSFYGFAGGASYNQGDTSASTTLADMNGDGLLDRVFAGNPITVGFNTGNGFEPPVAFHGSLATINADQNATLGAGAYFTITACVLTICAIVNPGADASVGASRSTQELRDINGDGFVDQLVSTKDNQLAVAENQTGRTNLLRTVTRPLGGRMDFDYTRDGNTYGQPQSKFVLSRVSVDDGQPGDGADVMASTYQYSGGVYDRLEREFDGYATVVARQVDPGAHDAVLRSVTRQYRTDGHYTRGLVTSQVVADSQGHPFLETDNTYSLRDVDNPSGAADATSTTATIFPQLVRTDQKFFEGQSTAAKSTFSTMAYDAFGNMTHVFDAGDVGTADDVDTTLAYSADNPSCQASNILGVPDTIDVQAGGNMVRHRESTVDCSTGDVTQARAMLANGDAAVTDMSYFASGNLKTVISPANQNGQRYRLDYTYDGTVDTYQASTVDSFGYRSSATYNLKFGEVETTTDENNQVVRNVYDSVGRLVTVTGPYEAPENRATITFEYHPEATVPYAITRHVDRQADNTVRSDTIDTITFVDGLDRVTQTKVDAAVSTGPSTAPANVMVVSGRTVFDALGRKVKEFFPVTEPKGSDNVKFNPAFDTVQPTVTTFDVLDRPTKTVLPDNTTTTVSYGFGADRAGNTEFESVATDANGKAARTYTDVRQHITAVRQANPAGGHPVVWTSYRYDALGDVTAVVDDQNNTTTSTYDNYGRRTSITSPDSGRTDYVYDLAGNLVKKVTANLAATQQAINYDYDFTRLKAIRYPVFTANNVTYTYGPPGAANNGADRITVITDAAGTVTRQYGPLGEVTSETRTTTAENHKTVSFTTQYTFDTWNRVLKMTYPDGEVLSYDYDSGGQVDSATGVKAGFTYNYLVRLDYDKFGQRVLLDTGNGTRTQYSYDSANRHLTNLKANLSQGYVFQNLNYTYDNVGNVTSIQNDTVAPSSPDVGMQVGGPSTQTFQYDDLNQLVHAQGSYQPRTPQTDTYSVDLHYDSVNNITNKTQTHQLISNGNTVTDGKLTYNYNYGYTGAGPHQAVTIGGFTFAYDADGNQISRTQQPGPRQQMIWDEENRLACSHANKPNTLPQTPASCDNAGGTPNDARYLYDDQGNRIVKDGAQFHIYPNQDYSTDGNKAFKHIYIGSTKLLTKSVEPNRFEDQQFYTHGDQLGSVGFVTDADGGLAEHLQYMPGGETWVSEHPSQPVPQQFSGKELDPETNLYYYGARYYDPRTQQWQSPDPILSAYLNGGPNQGVYDPSNLSSYTYAGNNPVRYTDPTGQSWKDWAWAAVKVAAVVAVGVATAGVGAAVIGAGLAAGTTAGYVAATAVVAVDAYYAGNAANIAITGKDFSGNKYDTGQRIAAGAGVGLAVAAPAIVSGLSRSGATPEPVSTSAAEPEPVVAPEPEPAPATAAAGQDEGPLLRGTSIGYAGSPGTQRVGIIPTTTDPGVATIFATHSEQFGQGVVQIAHPATVAGVARYPGYIASEAEVGLEISAADFASNADITISASSARSILNDMGIQVPGQVALSDISSTIAATPKLTPAQIEEFVCRAGDQYGQ